ncbi:MAG: hypothetical protein KQH83_03935 [Actinobacteria bacterium]|nr:hypothetical protein [Actinomycetota bacterium]
MTTADHAAGRPPTDWKLTTAHRVLTKVAWAAVVVALYGAAVAVLVGMEQGWWAAVGGASFALLVGALLPEPVPRDLLVGARNHIDTGAPR